MKCFDIEKAKDGATVCTREGKEVRILCYDMKYLDKDMLVVLVKQKNDEEHLRIYNTSGVSVEGRREQDLMMAPVKKKVWINLYKTECDNVLSDQITWDSKEEAEQYKDTKALGWIGAYEVEVEM